MLKVKPFVSACGISDLRVAIVPETQILIKNALVRIWKRVGDLFVGLCELFFKLGESDEFPCGFRMGEELVELSAQLDI